MDVLIAQFNNGHLSLEEIKTVLGSDFGQAWPTLQKKFKKDSNDLFFNERLETEIVKRREYSKSRSNNRKSKSYEKDMSNISKTHDEHMENENENRNEFKSIKGVGNFEETWKEAFDEITIQNYKMKYGLLDIPDELDHFKLKCDSNQADYYMRDAGGLRLGFLAQLRGSKGNKPKEKTKLVNMDNL